ncbi:hypothetical protein ACSA002_2560 [Salmonella phage vB_SalM_SA002]|nr:hypothetical protein ACSA002_2560 [Salmonella phage vB_SalM_SA002]
MTITARANIEFASNELFNDPEFRSKLEKHLPILRQRAVLVTGDKAPSLLDQDNDRGDFRMLLNEFGTPKYLHWLIMRINGITDPMRWNLMKEGMLVIDDSDSVLKGLITLHYTNKK